MHIVTLTDSIGISCNCMVGECVTDPNWHRLEKQRNPTPLLSEVELQWTIISSTAANLLVFIPPSNYYLTMDVFSGDAYYW